MNSQINNQNMTYYQNYLNLNTENIKLDQTQSESYDNYENYQETGLRWGIPTNSAFPNLQSRMNNFNNSNFTSQLIHKEEFQGSNTSNNLNSDKPWARAAKDPSIIQRGTEVFVGNLSVDTNENDLYENFKECGDIIDVRYINIYFLLDPTSQKSSK
jgi:3D (Asp-Asp-Asp) domain-containing protein